MRLFNKLIRPPGLRHRANRSRLAIAAGTAAVAIMLATSSGQCAFDNGLGEARVNPHNYGDRSLCSLCHKEAMPTLLFDRITTCARCHEASQQDHPVARHPLGKAPRIKTPGKLPLDRNGQIVCHTCHDQHNRSGNARMLRVPEQALCASCHVGY